MRVAVLAPIGNSPFALAVLERCRREPGVDVAGVLVRSHRSLARLRSELRRDGPRLLRKAWRKLVVGAPPDASGAEASFYSEVAELGLRGATLGAHCRTHGIPHRVVREPNEPDAVGWLRARRPDAVAFTGGGLVRRPLLEAAGAGVLNAHMGVLPPYRGMDVVEWPILEGRHESVGLGVSLHLMDRGVDTGPLVAVHRVPIRPGDTMERLRTRFEPVMVEAMLDGLRRIRDGTLAPRPQEAEEGRQYFVLHPRLYARARARLAELSGGPAEPAAAEASR